MKYFAVLTVFCKISLGVSQQIDSLSLISLISPQLDFLEDMCFNRTENSTAYQQLKVTFEDCHDKIINDTHLTLTYYNLLHTDPKEFYKFYIL